MKVKELVKQLNELIVYHPEHSEKEIKIESSGNPMKNPMPINWIETRDSENIVLRF